MMSKSKITSEIMIMKEVGRVRPGGPAFLKRVDHEFARMNFPQLVKISGWEKPQPLRSPESSVVKNGFKSGGGEFDKIMDDKVTRQWLPIEEESSMAG